MGYSGIAHYPRGSITYKGPGISLGGAGLKGRAPGCGVRDALRFEAPKIVRTPDKPETRKTIASSAPPGSTVKAFN